MRVLLHCYNQQLHSWQNEANFLNGIKGAVQGQQATSADDPQGNIVSTLATNAACADAPAAQHLPPLTLKQVTE
jgi:surface antigen